MSFGAVTRSGSAPANYARAIGGDMNTIWFGAYSPGSYYRLYELSTSDFSSVRNNEITVTYYLVGVGGDANAIWGTTPTGNKVIEFSTTDLSVVRSDTAPEQSVSGHGGMTNHIWHCNNYGLGSNYELSTVDFSWLHTLAPPSSDVSGMGGGNTRVWQKDGVANKLYELVGSSFAKTQEAAWTYTGGSVGGDDWTIWACDYTPNIYELDSGYTYYDTYPSDATLRVTGIRHVVRPGSYRMEVNFGDVTTQASTMTNVPLPPADIQGMYDWEATQPPKSTVTVPERTAPDLIAAIKKELNLPDYTPQPLLDWESKYYYDEYRKSIVNKSRTSMAQSGAQAMVDWEVTQPPQDYRGRLQAGKEPEQTTNIFKSVWDRIKGALGE